MTFSIQTKDFIKVLNSISKVIQKSEVNPILSYALLTKSESGGFRLTGSSSDNSLSVNIGLVQTDHDDLTPICLPVGKLLAALSLLPSQAVEITLRDGELNIKHREGILSLPTYNADEYPQMPPIGNDWLEFSLPTNVFLSATKAAMTCASTGELRPVMNSVALDVNNEGVVFVASDGHSLYKYDYVHGVPFLQKGAPQMVLVPAKIISAMENPFADADIMTIKFDKQRIYLHSDNADFIIRNCEGNYPNYNAVIPKENPYHVELNVRDLSSSLQRTMLMADEETSAVKLKYEKDELSLLGASVDFSTSAYEHLASDNVTLPNNFSIAFNAQSMLKMLKNIGTEKLKLEMSDKNKPLILREVADNSPLLELLMPLLDN